MSTNPISEAFNIPNPTPEDAPEIQLDTTSTCPDGIPDKFWDSEQAEVKTELLLQSYLELERKLGSTLPRPKDESDFDAIQRLQSALGRPGSAEDYEIESSSELLAVDAKINARLYEAGFNQQQAQLVYDLANEHVGPIIEDALQEVETVRQLDRLHDHFGGEQAWAKTSRQLKSWGEAHLSPEVFDALASSYDGVLALNELMSKSEPDLAGDGAGGGSGFTEDTLNEMVRDPRYWRDREPEFVARVTDGFKRLFPT